MLPGGLPAPPAPEHLQQHHFSLARVSALLPPPAPSSCLCVAARSLWLFLCGWGREGARGRVAPQDTPGPRGKRSGARPAVAPQPPRPAPGLGAGPGRARAVPAVLGAVRGQVPPPARPCPPRRRGSAAAHCAPCAARAELREGPRPLSAPDPPGRAGPRLAACAALRGAVSAGRALRGKRGCGPVQGLAPRSCAEGPCGRARAPPGARGGCGFQRPRAGRRPRVGALGGSLGAGAPGFVRGCELRWARRSPGSLWEGAWQFSGSQVSLPSAFVQTLLSLSCSL